MKNNLPSLKGQKILITGGLGFIGSNLAHQCVQLGAEVTIYDSLDPRSGGHMANVRGIQEKISIIRDDIRNPDGFNGCIIGQDVVFNCAAYTSHPNSMKEPYLDIDVNCKGVINLLEAARRLNRKAMIVHVGTSTQIGSMVHQPVDELHPEFPKEIYSANKSVSEKYTLIYGDVYDMPVSVVRLTNVFGPRSSIKNGDFGFINYFIGLALQGKNLTVYGKGQQSRNLLYVEDAVSALILASQSSEARGEVFLAAGDRQYSVKDIAETIVRVLGLGSVTQIDWPKEREVIEIGDAIISNNKIKKTILWQPQFDLESGLIKTKAYFESCLKEYLS